MWAKSSFGLLKFAQGFLDLFLGVPSPRHVDTIQHFEYRVNVGARSGLEGGQGYDGDAVVGLVAVAECGEHDETGWFSAPGGVDL